MGLGIQKLTSSLEPKDNGQAPEYVGNYTPSVFTDERVDVALFGGKNAKTFPVLAGKKQEELIKSGVSETEAWKETKVFNKVDEQTGTVIDEFNPQRFEIDDSKATFISDSVWKMNDDESEKVQLSLADIGTYKGDDIGAMIPKMERRGGGFVGGEITYEQIGMEQNNAVSTLGEIFKHDDLFAAYPEYKDMRVELTTSDVDVVGKENMDNPDVQEISKIMGAYYPYENKIVINMKYFKGEKDEEIKKTLIHEIQHLIDTGEMTDAERKSPFTSGKEQRKLYPFLKTRRLPRSAVSKEVWARESAWRMNASQEDREAFAPFGKTSQTDETNDNTIDQMKRLEGHKEHLVSYVEADVKSDARHKEFQKGQDEYQVKIDKAEEAIRILDETIAGRPKEAAIQKRLARNIRNNNLGNIKKTDDNWEGSTSNSREKTFVTFKTPEHGIRALNRVIDANLNATNSYETYVNRYASEPKEQAYFKKNGRLMPHLLNYAITLANSQGMDTSNSNWVKQKPKNINKLEWIKATATAEGGKGALTYFTDKIINGGLKLK